MHKPFAKWIPTQTFRYLACGGGNTVFGLVLFSVIYNKMFLGKDVAVGAMDFSLFDHFYHLFAASDSLRNVHITSRVATMLITMAITVPIGFFLSSYVVFPESQIRGRVQLFRYVAFTFTFLFLSYALTRTFEIMLPMVPGDIANIFITAINAFLSYLSQRFYTFKITKEEGEEME